jgi:hypothetical protein
MATTPKDLPTKTDEAARQIIEIHELHIAHYPELKELMLEAYPDLPDAYWKREQIEKLIRKFP